MEKNVRYKKISCLQNSIGKISGIIVGNLIGYGIVLGIILLAN